MKKALTICIAIILAFVLVGCEKNYTPDPDVEQFLNTGLKASVSFAAIDYAEYTTVVMAYNGNNQQIGSSTLTVSFDKSDAANLSFYLVQEYMGNQIAGNLLKTETSLVKIDGKYKYTVSSVYANLSDVQTTEEQVDAQFALDLITAQVYLDNGAYNEGGLYYGDMFMQRIYKYPAEAFYVDKQNNLCVFDAVVRFDHATLGKVAVKQLIKVNELGLLTYLSEEYRGEQLENYMLTEMHATYRYAPTQNS